MKSDLLFLLIMVTAIVSVLYLVWKKTEVQNTEKRMLHYILLHLLVALHIVLLAGGLAITLFLGREGTVNWLLDSPAINEIMNVISVIWLLGFTGTFLWCLYQHGRDMMRYRSRSHASEEVAAMCCAVCEDMGLTRVKAKVWHVYGLQSPELGGWFRPVIYLPKEDYDDEMLVNILIHELIHFTYGDRWFRELGMLVLCIYWFNPIAWRMIRQLKLWDEYHCDYQVCCCNHIERDSYIRTLCSMILNVQSQNLLNPCFAEDGSDMVRRLEYIMKYEKINRKKWIATVMAVAAIFSVIGSGTALAAGTAVNETRNHVALLTAEHYELEQDDEVELVEYTMTADEVAGVEIIADTMEGEITPWALYTINVSLKNAIYQSPSFSVSTGDSIYVTVAVDPTDVNIKVGIVQPNGVWRYVYGAGALNKTFDVTMSGSHKVFVWNETNTEVGVAGAYRVTTAN